MVTLRDLLEAFDEHHGVARVVIMRQMREYVDNTPTINIIKEIEDIDNSKWLDVLYGVGMRRPLNEIVQAHKARLEGWI